MAALLHKKIYSIRFDLGADTQTTINDQGRDFGVT